MRDWPKKRMSEITSLITDGKHGDCENEENSGYYFLSSKDLREGKLHYDDAREIRHSGFIETHRRTNLQPGDILLANCGASIGRVGLAQNDTRIYKTTFQKSISVIKPKKEIVNNKYLYYFILCNNSHLIDLGGGTAQPNLLISDLKKIKIPLPPIRIQKKIAAVLSAYDDLIENNNRRIAILGKMAEELYREWFVRLRFPGHEKVKIIKGVPEGWEVKILENIAHLVKEKFVMHEHSSLPLVDLEKMAQKTLAITTIGTPGELTTSRIIFKENDVLFSSIRPYLYKVNMAPFSGVTNTSVMVIRPLNKQYRSYLTILLFLKDSIAWADQYSTGTKMPVISWDVFKRMEIFDPPSDLVYKFESIVSPCLNDINLYARSNLYLHQSRNRLLSRLMSGKIDAENMDIQFPTSMRCAEPVEAQEESVHA